MRLLLIQRIFGLLLVLFSSALLPPVLVSVIYHDVEFLHFVESLALILTAGLCIWLPVRHKGGELRRREGFLVVAMFWFMLSAVGSLPFLLGGYLSFTDSFFEAASAFTTTGATVMTGLDAMPQSLLFYRQELQWLGGMGVIVLAVAVMPMLGIGGMQLYRAETPGPMKDEKITPRIAQSARALWYIYVGLTLACAISYWLAGMGPFDALAHSLSTISTGGFSTHDASLAYFHSAWVEWVAVVFMALGGINFSIHFLVWHKRHPGSYWRDAEVRGYLLLLLALSCAVALILFLTHARGSLVEALRPAAVQVVSLMTSTGFVSEDFTRWPLLLPILLILLGFIGGCAGSTAGGMKVIRILVLFKQGLRHLRQLVHPSLRALIKVDDRVLPDRVTDAIWGFFSVYVAIFAMLMMAVTATGLDAVTAFSAVATCMNNMGPGVGQIASNFQSVSDTGTWLLAFAMLLGRLEIFTVLVLLSPAFWRY